MRTHAGADILLGRDCLGSQAPMRCVNHLIDGSLLTPASMWYSKLLFAAEQNHELLVTLLNTVLRPETPFLR